MELIRRGYNAFIGKVNSMEVDFVVENTNGTEYYQVAATVRDTVTLQRELAPLQIIHDHYQKLLLTLDENPPDNFNGIRKVNVLDWLLQ